MYSKFNCTSYQPLFEYTGGNIGVTHDHRKHQSTVDLDFIIFRVNEVSRLVVLSVGAKLERYDGCIDWLQHDREMYKSICNICNIRYRR